MVSVGGANSVVREGDRLVHEGRGLAPEVKAPQVQPNARPRFTKFQTGLGCAQQGEGGGRGLVRFETKKLI